MPIVGTGARLRTMHSTRTNHYGTGSDGQWGQEPHDTWKCNNCGIIGQWMSSEPQMCGTWPPILRFSKYNPGTDFGSAASEISRPCKWCSKVESEHFDAEKFCFQFGYQYGKFCCICYAHRFGCDQWCGQVCRHTHSTAPFRVLIPRLHALPRKRVLVAAAD